MALKVRNWDSTEHLKTEEDVALYLDETIHSGNRHPAIHRHDVPGHGARLV